MQIDKSNRRIATQAVKLGMIDTEEAQENLRILAVRRDIGEPTSIDRILFERDLISSEQVYELQCRTELRLVFCPNCNTRHNQYEKSPGAKARCGRCQTKYRIPGADPASPFELPQRKARPKIPETGGAIALGLLGVLAVGALFVGAALGSWGTTFGIPAVACAAVFLTLAFFLGRQKRFLATAGIGLALFAGLVTSAAVLTTPESGALSLLGVGAHRLVGPLVLVHMGLLIYLGLPHMRRVESPILYLILIVPLCYGALFFVSRCFPGTDVAAVVAGPDTFSQVPWYLHPGIVTLLALFPLGALSLLGSGLVRRLRQEPGTLQRECGLIAGLLVLAAYGLTVGTLRDELPIPGLRADLDRTLGGRQAAWLEPAAESGIQSTAAAATEGQPPK